MFIIQKILYGLRSLLSAKESRMYISITALRQIQSALSLVDSAHFEVVLFCTMYIIIFFGFFRVSEIAVERQHGDINKVVQFSKAILTLTLYELVIPSAKKLTGTPTRYHKYLHRSTIEVNAPCERLRFF